MTRLDVPTILDALGCTPDDDEVLQATVSACEIAVVAEDDLEFSLMFSGICDCASRASDGVREFQLRRLRKIVERRPWSRARAMTLDALAALLKPRIRR